MLALVATVSWYRDRVGLVHETAGEHPGAPAEHPTSVHEHGWSWSPPGDVDVIDLVRGTHGPVAVLADGLVALDGTTGRELWTYREMGVSAPDPDVFAGPGWGVLGEHAYFLRPPGPDAPGGFLALDTATGEIVWERDVAAEETVDGWNAYSPLVQLHSPDTGPEGGDHGVVLARSPRDGTDLWEFQAPWLTESCTLQGTPLLHSARNSGQVLVAHACANETELAELSLGDPSEDPLVFAGRAESLTLHVTALDPRTGHVLWSERRPISGPGDPVALRLLDRSPPVPGEPPAVLVESGPELARPFVNDAAGGREVRYPGEALDGDHAPNDPAGRTLRADTSGLVVAVDSAHEPYVPDTEWAFEALGVDSQGRVVSSVTVEEEVITADHLARTIALEGTLLVPHLDADGARSRVYAAGMDSGTEGGAWLEPRPVSRTAGSDDIEIEHRLLAVPGAVLSYLSDGVTVTDVHALVP